MIKSAGIVKLHRLFWIADILGFLPQSTPVAGGMVGVTRDAERTIDLCLITHFVCYYSVVGSRVFDKKTSNK